MTDVLRFPIQELPAGIDPQEYSLHELATSLRIEYARNKNLLANGQQELTPQLEAFFQNAERVLAKHGYL